MKRILFAILLLLCSPDFLSAQEGTYVVTHKDGKIPVYNHDQEIIGYLRRGEKVQVTLFHHELPQVDNSKSKPVTFVEYKGEEGILYLGSADWLKCKSTTAIDPENPDTTITIDPTHSISLLLATGMMTLLVLLYMAKPCCITNWRIRDRIFNTNRAVALSVVLLIIFSAEFYCLYHTANPLWFCQWEQVGLGGMMVGLMGMIVLLFIKYTTISTIISALANTARKNYKYFDYKTSFFAAFVGTWVILIVGNWNTDWKENLQSGIAIAVVVFLLYEVRHVIRQRHFVAGILIVFLLITGVSTLCYVSLEVFRRILEIITIIYIVVFCVQGIRNKRFQRSHDGDDFVDYYDYGVGKSRRLYKDGTGNYIDYTDGSSWGKRGDTNDFNRYN